MVLLVLLWWLLIWFAVLCVLLGCLVLRLGMRLAGGCGFAVLVFGYVGWCFGYDC